MSSAGRLDKLDVPGARRRSALMLALAATALVAGCSSTPSSGVCTGVDGCRVVGHADVDGDGQSDDIGLVRAGGAAQQRGSVTLRVAISEGHVVSLRLPLENWAGAVWVGAATLDAAPGKDLMVGRLMGASAQFYQSVSWRGGRLVRLDAPGPDRWWAVGKSATSAGGWQRAATDPAGLVRWRVASVVRPGRMRGLIATYRWKAGGWQRTGVRVVAPLSPAEADGWVGFHVPGLARR